MGQYGNQPDFGTRAASTVPTGLAIETPSAVEPGINLKSAALYIGTGGTLVCRVVGGNNGYGNSTVFKNIPDGTFFPVVVDYVFTGDDNGEVTTCSDIVALY